MVNNTTTQRRDDRTLLDAFERQYMRQLENLADETIRNYRNNLRVFFRWYKTEKQGMDEEEFVHYKETFHTSENPKYSVEEVLEMSKREFIEAVKTNEIGVMDIYECLEAMEDMEETFYKTRELEKKKRKIEGKDVGRARRKLDYVEVTEEDIQQVTHEDVFDFVTLYLRDKREVVMDTAYSYYTAIRKFFDWGSFGHPEHIYLNAREPLNLDFLKKIIKKSFPDPEEGGGKVLDFEKVKKMIRENRHPKHQALLILLFKTGLLRKEVTNIQLKDIYWDEQYIRVEDRKNEHNSNVLMDEEVIENLKLYLKGKEERHKQPDDYLFTYHGGQKYSKSTIAKMVKQCATKAGIEIKKNKSGKTSKVSTHWTRHTFSNFYSNNVGNTEEGKVLDLKIQLAHSLGTTGHYQADKTNIKRSRKQRRRDYERAVPILT